MVPIGRLDVVKSLSIMCKMRFRASSLIGDAGSMQSLLSSQP
jgi:hypothetical protein